MRRQEKVAVTFAPYVAIAELENTLALNRNMHAPPFLRRNLSYSASTNQTEREEMKTMRFRASHCVNISLEIRCPGQVKDPYMVLFVSMCAIVESPDGSCAFVPVIARIARVPIPLSPSSSDSKDHSVTVNLPVSLPGGMLTTDVSLLVLYKSGSDIKDFVSYTMRGMHRDYLAGQSTRGVTCDILPDRIFYWIPTGAPLLYSTIQIIEPMGTEALRCGVVVLQPGKVTPHVAPQGTSSFSIDIGDVGDASPVIRYSISVSAQPQRPQHLPGSIAHQVNPSLHGQSSKERPDPAVNVSYCGVDGTIRAVARVPAFVCPFESCRTRCRNFSSLKQHLTTSHLYYEFFFMDGGGNQMPSRSRSSAERVKVWEIFVRCKMAWFSVDGTFLPWECSMAEVGEQHPLSRLLHKSAIWLVFEYYCPRKDRWMRYAPHAIGPQDERDVALEAAAQNLSEKQKNAERFLAYRASHAGHAAPFTSSYGPVSVEGESDDDENGGTATICDVGDGNGSAVEVLPRVGEKVMDRAGIAREVPIDGNSIRPDLGRVVGRKTKFSSHNASHPISLLTPDGKPKFYHAKSCVAITSVAELKGCEDSDDDTDTEEWTRDCVERIEENSCLCSEERDFMLEWNLHLYNHTLHADSQVASSCIAFAQQHKERLSKDPGGSFRKCFVAHLTNLWKFRLLSPAQIQEALLVAPSADAQQ